MDGVFAEGQKAFKDSVPNAATARRLGTRALPVVAAFVAGTGVLCWKKFRDPPSADFLGRRASFVCQARSAWVSRGMPDAAAMQRALEHAGADLAPLRRAARRMRGPIESELMAVEAALGKTAAESRSQLYAKLVQAWREAGYFSEPVECKKPPHFFLGLDLVKQEDVSYGNDVGCEVALSLLRDEASAKAAGAGEVHGLEPGEWERAAEALREHGVVLLRGLLPHDDVLAIRERLQVQVSALDWRRTRKGQMPPVRDFDPEGLLEEDPELTVVGSAPGRRHCILRRQVLEGPMRGAQAGAMPLVWQHLAADANAVSGGTEKRAPYVSEMQLLVTDPCAEDQFWHIDNRFRGLTLFIPITDVPADLGPDVFLPGSHHLFDESLGHFSRVRKFMSSFLASDGVSAGTMKAGDALVYDSRIIHRDAANTRYDRSRLALVFRYDFERPPGYGVLGTQLVAWSGKWLASLGGLYSSLPGGTKNE